MLYLAKRCYSTFPRIERPTLEQIQFANRIFQQPATFVKSIAQPDQAPNTTCPEVAFVGRSNVGKSTLINKLLNRKGLVKTSSKPGHTRLVNFFSIGDKMHLVDMPGYGYQSREEWGDSIMGYLTSRDQLKRTFVLIDSTVGLKAADLQLFEFFDKFAISYQVILTKRDRITEKKFQENKEALEASVFQNAVCCYPELLASGQQRKSRRAASQAAAIDEGIQDIRWAIVNAAGLYKPPSGV